MKNLYENEKLIKSFKFRIEIERQSDIEYKEKLLENLIVFKKILRYKKL